MINLPPQTIEEVLGLDPTWDGSSYWTSTCLEAFLSPYDGDLSELDGLAEAFDEH